MRFDHLIRHFACGGISAALIAVGVAGMSPANGDEKASPAPEHAKRASNPDPLTPEAEQAANTLKKTLPADSEARHMLDAILQGSRLGPGEGWFRVAVGQTRFGWDFVRKHFDADGDGRVTPEEFAGSEADFRRLDRNVDHAITETDLSWDEHALSRTPGMMLFYQADGDANGRITPDEWKALFQSLGGEKGYLALNDVRNEFQPPDESQRRRRRDRPNRSTLILGLSRQEIGALEPGPSLNAEAPDFTLKTVDGRRAVTLSEEIGPQPVVLVFGNFTCGPFRAQGGNVASLYRRYKDRAKFLMVYVREAHPKDGWWMESNRRVGIDLVQPTSDNERTAVAAACQSHLEFEMPFLVDTIDDRVGTQYSGMPNRLYLIDGDGRIAYKSGRGPFGFKPAELEQSLILLLQEQKRP